MKRVLNSVWHLSERKQLIDAPEIEEIVAKIARIPAKSVSTNDVAKLANLEKEFENAGFWTRRSDFSISICD
jgi:ATP-dependent Clp protease ATP-binding subunit ClpA